MQVKDIITRGRKQNGHFRPSLSNLRKSYMIGYLYIYCYTYIQCIKLVQYSTNQRHQYVRTIPMLHFSNDSTIFAHNAKPRQQTTDQTGCPIDVQRAKTHVTAKRLFRSLYDFSCSSCISRRRSATWYSKPMVSIWRRYCSEYWSLLTVFLARLLPCLCDDDELNDKSAHPRCKCLPSLEMRRRRVGEHDGERDRPRRRAFIREWRTYRGRGQYSGMSDDLQ